MPTVPTIEPWVKPYERERLGDPIMKLSRDALPDKHFEHVRVVREGARGATGVPGGRLWLQLRRRSASGGACWRCSAACSAACSASPAARAADLPENKAEALFHSYSGGGVKAYGPAFLVRKSIFDKVSLTGTYYVDAVSNASIDVVTTASPYQRDAPRVRPQRRLRLPRRADHVRPDDQPRARLRRQHRQPRRDAGGLRRHDDDRLRLHPRQRHGQEAQRARVPGQRRPLAVPPRRDPDPDAALAHERELRGARPTRATSAARTASPASSAPPCRSATPRTRSGRAVKLRLVGDLGNARRDARRVPLLHRHLGHQGAHRRDRLQPLLRRELARRLVLPLLHADAARSSTATTPRARRCTSRATAS